jgi:hypothetical protein
MHNSVIGPTGSIGAAAAVVAGFTGPTGPAGSAKTVPTGPTAHGRLASGCAAPVPARLFDDDEETWACLYSIDDVIDDDCDATPKAAGNGGDFGAIAAQPPSLQGGSAREALAAAEQLQPHPHPMLAAALSYAERGWDIFPVPPGEKKSYKSEKYSNGAKWGKTRDPEQIRRDFQRWPEANIGIPTGKDNGFWVLETDTPKGHGVDGNASLRKLEDKHGPLPQTLMAESPSGSRHYYFNWPKGIEIRNSASGIDDGIDVRGKGGMVIAPPSVRGDSEYRWLNDNPIADAPQWLLDLVIAPSPSSGKGADAVKPSLGFEVADAFRHFPTADLAEGIEYRTAHIEQIRAAFAVIPNDDRGWDDWNRCGLALFHATAGSDDGLAVFHAWSSKSEKYDAQVTADRWAAYKTCPPTKIGVGSIFYWANEAAPSWETLIGMPLEQAMKIAALIPLSTFDYEVKRRAIAKELGMRIGALDKIVERMRTRALEPPLNLALDAEKRKHQEPPKADLYKPSNEYEPINCDTPELAGLDAVWVGRIFEGDTEGAYQNDQNLPSQWRVNSSASDLRFIARVLMTTACGTYVQERPAYRLLRTIRRAHEFAIDPDLEKMNSQHAVLPIGDKT